ncbi:copper homeostasis protein CutC [Gordonia sihwensis]|uniref:copper homeostasis protein CutC n=1 Tax=Gordonia sihwensis TaxID=173559 RepID=UPI0024169E2A|nr:copper homeostasis protein CutC [Gordonia sihwensis]WFN91306.1 copper homeostasis protein CutC [Gordonia sihwensis]
MQDAEGAATARANGADRVELCTALGVTGGLTPSAGLLDAVCAVGIDVHALIRTRPGGFVYSDAEVDVLAADVAAAVRLAVRLGARGVVIGALHADGTVDAGATGRLLAAARDAEQRAGRRIDVTFHRAIDAAADPIAALTVLAGLGVDRVLTSGGAARAGDGLDVLRALVAADTGVEVMAGGGRHGGGHPCHPGHRRARGAPVRETLGAGSGRRRPGWRCRVGSGDDRRRSGASGYESSAPSLSASSDTRVRYSLPISTV